MNDQQREAKAEWYEQFFQTCRTCEHFVPRAGMCVAPYAGLRGAPLKRSARDSCDAWEMWRPPSDGVREFQYIDRRQAP